MAIRELRHILQRNARRLQTIPAVLRSFKFITECCAHVEKSSITFIPSNPFHRPVRDLMKNPLVPYLRRHRMLARNLGSASLIPASAPQNRVQGGESAQPFRRPRKSPSRQSLWPACENQVLSASNQHSRAKFRGPHRDPVKFRWHNQ